MACFRMISEAGLFWYTDHGVQRRCLVPVSVFAKSKPEVCSGGLIGKLLTGADWNGRPDIEERYQYGVEQHFI